MTQIAVLTGDIVASTDLEPSALGALFDELKVETARIFTWSEGSAPFSRRGGDGWQLALEDARIALRAALALQCACKSHGVETRVSIAQGAYDLPFPLDLNEAFGDVFTASGRALDALPRHVLITHASAGPIGAAAALADQISQQWTKPQAAAVRLALDPASGARKDIAKVLGKSRQAVDQALRAAGFAAIERALDLIEESRDAS